MKRIKNLTLSLVAAVFMLGLAMNFNACGNASSVQSFDQSAATTRAPGELKILKSTDLSLGKLFVAEKLITVKGGGKVEVGDKQHGVSSLDFKPGDVSADVLVTFNWESTGLLEGGAQFSPHGIYFNNPVEIELSYKDADLTGIDEATLKIWYFNETTGLWELVAGDVHMDGKYIKGTIEHFSRYAIGAE